MKIRAVFLTLTLCLVGFAGLGHGADVAKIGVIDFQKIIDTSSVGKRSAVEWETRSKEMRKTLEDKGAELEKLKKELEQKALVMSEEAREKKERDLQILLMDARSLQKRYSEEAKELNEKLSKDIMKDVFEIIQKIGKKGGYQLILRRELIVVYAPDAIDITDKVVEAYDELDAKRKKKYEPWSCPQVRLQSW